MPQKGGSQSSRITVSTYRTTCEVDITDNSTGLDIIQDVCNTFKLPEPGYFGVKVKRELGFYWIDNDETVRLTCGKKWREEVKVMEFRVRFFPPDLTRITNDNIVHMYFLHIRDELMKGSMMCEPAAAISLAALILQAESGNYDERVHTNEFIIHADCIPQRYSKDNSVILNSITMEYQQFSGLRPVEAELVFLEKAQSNLAECGVEYYVTKDKSGQVFSIGAGHDGVFIKHNKIDNLILFKWIDIVSMRYEHKYLWLEVMDKKPNTFDLANKEVAKIVFNSFIAQHNFKLGKRLPAPSKTYGSVKRSIQKDSFDKDDEGSRDSNSPKRTLITNGTVSPSKTDFRNDLLKMIGNPDEIVMEYISVPKTKPEGTHIAANLPENKPKNRFRDIVPYDDNRVLLKEGPDYINASHVNIQRAQNQYILCQGPKDNTVDDFWRMIWQQGITVISMVTQLREGYRAKCYQYWPDDEGGTTKCGDIIVTLSFARDDVLYVTRGFTLYHTPTQRSMDVVHLQFTSWPDHGVPKTPKDLLDYLDELQSLLKEVKAPFEGAVPLLIHCSAGVGRSGVLVMMDILTRAFNNNQIVDIPGTLRDLRQCRSHSVQTEEQYIFVYNAMLSYVDHYQGRLI